MCRVVSIWVSVSSMLWVFGLRLVSSFGILWMMVCWRLVSGIGLSSCVGGGLCIVILLSWVWVSRYVRLGFFGLFYGGRVLMFGFYVLNVVWSYLL